MVFNIPNKVRHHKVQHRDSNDSVTLRLMTEHDLAMLYEWLNRSHIVEWWGGEEARPTLADVQERYLPSVLAQVRHSIHCNAEWRADLGMPSRTLLLEAGTDGGKKKPIQEYAE